MKYLKLIHKKVYSLSYKDVWIQFPSYKFSLKAKDGFLLTVGGDDFKVVYDKKLNKFKPVDNNLLFNRLINKDANYFDFSEKNYMRKYVDFITMVSHEVL